LDRLGEEIDLAPKQVAEPKLKLRQANQRDVLVAIEFDGKIDVTVAAGIAARERAEQREMPDPAGPQLGCVRLQAGDDLVGRYRSIRTHPLSEAHHNMASPRLAAKLIPLQWQASSRFHAVHNTPPRSQAGRRDLIFGYQTR